MANPQRVVLIIRLQNYRKRAPSILERCEQKTGLRCVLHKWPILLSRGMAESLCEEHRQRRSFPELVTSLSGGTSMVLVLEGDGAEKRIRRMNGSLAKALLPQSILIEDGEPIGIEDDSLAGAVFISPEGVARATQALFGTG